MRKYLLIAGLLYFNIVSGQSPEMNSYPESVRQEALAARQHLNELKARHAKLQKDIDEKKRAAEEAIAKAEENTRAATEATSRLSQNPQDKSLSSTVKKMNRESKRLDRQAQKAASDVAKVQDEIEDVEKQIVEAEQRLAVFSSAGGSMDAGAGAPGAATADPALSGVRKDSLSAPARAAQAEGTMPEAAQRVVEQTYKNYPQQPGQPTIIINNIIVPSDYQNRQAGAFSPASGVAGYSSGYPAGGTARDAARPQPSEEEWREYQAYRDWLRYNGQGPRSRRYTGAYRGDEEQAYRNLTFKERFGELSARKSGVWVIPRVGLHAANFEADFKNNEATGRSGWNAGLDFRAHVNRLFIQPGVHYFNTSLDLTSKDSLDNVSLTSGPKIHSLKVPLLAGLYLTKARDAFLKFNIRGGIVGNYVMSVDKAADSDFRKENLETYTYGLNAGIGIELGLITIDISHEWGMNSMFKDADVKNNLLRATLGVKL